MPFCPKKVRIGRFFGGLRRENADFEEMFSREKRGKNIDKGNERCYNNSRNYVDAAAIEPM